MFRVPRATPLNGGRVRQSSLLVQGVADRIILAPWEEVAFVCPNRQAASLDGRTRHDVAQKEQSQIHLGPDPRMLAY